MKIGRLLLVAALCLGSCAEADLGPSSIGTPTTQDLAIASPEIATSGPGTTSEPSGSLDGICAAFDRHVDLLLTDPDSSLLGDVLTGDYPRSDPLLSANNGPFGEEWHELMTELVERDPSDQRPLVETANELWELNQLSARQCGYPVFSAVSAITCDSYSGDQPTCEGPTDPRAEYRRFQQTLEGVETYFEVDGSDWLSEIPGEQLAAMAWTETASEVLIRVDEDDIPELGLWIAAFLESNEFDFDTSSLRDPAFWDRAPHRAIYLSIAVVGGLFGSYESPTNPEGMTLNVRTLASPLMDSSTGGDAQDLYLIGSEFGQAPLTDEEILPIYQALAIDESLILVSIS